ncbi:MAG TPA: porphobilinogen synthase [Candidatus Bathyarchaeia archaeon]|nr:porphobilinogen synthase [Candidatus Bathyarchaeia archaeon]
MSFPTVRLRRLRRTPALRRLVQKVSIQPSNLVCPILVDENASKPAAIPSMPDYYRLPLRNVVDEAKRIVEQGVKAILLFGLPSKKDEKGSEAFAANGVVQKAIKGLKKQFGDKLVVMTDVCLCEYTSHGHCGILKGSGVQNDATVEILAKIAVSHAEAGADVVAPSAMMDGQVKSIRTALDDAGFSQVGIMSYSAKFASCFYGPFRDAAECAPQFSDRKSYQMGYENVQEALREIELDVNEGADIIMVKPALAYLDVISAARSKFNLPIAAYNVSGEYSMVKAAAKMGWIDEKAVILEILTGIKRAGADFIITYFAKDIGTWL